MKKRQMMHDSWKAVMYDSWKAIMKQQQGFEVCLRWHVGLASHAHMLTYEMYKTNILCYIGHCYDHADNTAVRILRVCVRVCVCVYLCNVHTCRHAGTHGQTDIRQTDIKSDICKDRQTETDVPRRACAVPWSTRCRC